jgi:uncharacterized protein
MPTEPSTGHASKGELTFSIDYRIIALLLSAIIVAMLFLWRPWSGGTGDRTVAVTGQTVLRATPDEFIFYPVYQVQNNDKQSALDALNTKSETVVAKLKELGVADKAIKTSTSGYDYPIYDMSSEKATYTAQLTVTLQDQVLAQKVLDYLMTTAPTGSVSPQLGFSDAKQKDLEAKARNDATKDARAKAEQMGKNLGFRLGKVKVVTDGTGFGGGPVPLQARETIAAMPAQKDAGTQLHPGENELPYAVTITYFIR